MENKIRIDLARILNETYKSMAKRYQEMYKVGKPLGKVWQFQHSPDLLVAFRTSANSQTLEYGKRFIVPRETKPFRVNILWNKLYWPVFYYSGSH